MDKVIIPEVLTLEEASGYLRLSIETVAVLDCRKPMVMSLMLLANAD
jgi:hypothetical protein